MQQHSNTQPLVTGGKFKPYQIQTTFQSWLCWFAVQLINKFVYAINVPNKKLG